MKSLMRAVYIGAYIPYVGLPLSAGLAVRVGDVESEHNSLSADVTLSHLYIPPYSNFQTVIITHPPPLAADAIINPDIIPQPRRDCKSKFLINFIFRKFFMIFIF